MATLTEALTPEYSRLASKLTGNPNRVTVEVEDDIDAEFWADILREQCPEKEFHFNPYQTITNGKEYVEVTGKSRIIKMAETLNRFHIGCVDSDYDWMLSNSTVYGKTITSTPFLLQTYAYSIENLMCAPETLTSLVHSSCDEDTDFDFTSYFNVLSSSVYPLLIWSLYLKSKNCQGFTPRDWTDILPHNSKDIEVIKTKVSEAIKDLEAKHVGESADVKVFENELKNKLQLEESYLYVQGHALFDHIHRAVLKPIVDSLSKQHFNELTETKDKVTYSKNIKQSRIDILLSNNYRYKPYSKLYKVICSDIAAIWKKQ